MFRSASLIDDDDSGGDLDLDAFSFAQFVQNQGLCKVTVGHGLVLIC